MGEQFSNRVSAFSRTVDKSQEWVNELHSDLKWVSADSVYHLMKAVLQTLREQLSIDEAAHLSAQLPMLLRGAYYEGWDPQVLNSSGLGKDEFVAAVKAKLGPIGEPHYSLEEAIFKTINVIKNHVSRGEMDDVVSVLKPTLRSFINRGERLIHL